MDGLAALKEIRKLDPGARVPLFTAMGQQAIVIKPLKNAPGISSFSRFNPKAGVGPRAKLLGGLTSPWPFGEPVAKKLAFSPPPCGTGGT